MKKSTFLLILFLASGFSNPLFSQFMDYIDEVRGDGDTVIVKSFADMEYQANSLIDAIASDTTETGERANPDRVYLLKRGEFYPLDRRYSTPSGHNLTIMGEDGPLVGGETEDGALPQIYGTTDATGDATDAKFFKLNNNTTFKNVGFCTAADNGDQGFQYFQIAAADKQVSFDNCLFEHTSWNFVNGSKVDSAKVRFENSYFVNMNGHPCRRNGGVYDNVNNNTQEIYVENCTHVMASGMMYKFRNYPIYHAYFNHNTFVNCVGNIFETFGYQVNWVVTNNLFVNSNCQAYYPGLDIAETDQDSLPTGIINLNQLEGIDEWFPGGFAEADRKILVDKNAVYWDSRLDQIIADLKEDDGGLNKEWYSQMITMNSRTQEMFDDDENYPLLYEGNWIMDENPEFYQMDDQVPNIISFCKATVFEESVAVLPKWRADGNEITDENKDNMVYPDWPLNCNLQYSNETLKSAGLSGFPVGDLNWFAYLMPTWKEQAGDEHAAIIAALDAGTEPEAQSVTIPTGVTPTLGVDFTLKNFPNPCKYQTVISYRIPSSGYVSLRIHDIQGKVVKTVVEKYHPAGNYKVDFSVTDLNSGTYFYSLSLNGIQKTNKMIVN